MLAAAAGRARTSPASWSAPSTTDNTAGDGLVMPCQPARYADPKGPAALVRTFDTEPPRQATASTPGVRRPDGRGVPQPAGRRPRLRHRARLVRRLPRRAGPAAATRRVDGVGDAALLFVLRDWDRPARTTVVGVARTGRLTTTTTTRLPGAAHPVLGTRPGCSAPPSTACAASRPAGTARSDPGSARSRRCPWRGARHAHRGRPAPRPGSRPAVGRHGAPQGDEQRRRHPLRPGRLQLPADDQQRHPHVRDPGLPAARPVRPHRDRRLAPGRARSGVRGRYPRPDGRLPGQGPRHRGHRAAAGPHRAGRPERLAGAHGDQRPVVGRVPDGDRPPRHVGDPGRVRPGRRGDHGARHVRRAGPPRPRPPGRDAAAPEALTANPATLPTCRLFTHKATDPS